MDGREHQGHVFVDDGAEEDRGRKDPYQGAKTRGTFPIDDPEVRLRVHLALKILDAPGGGVNVPI